MNPYTNICRCGVIAALALSIVGCATTPVPTEVADDKAVVPFQTEAGEAGY
ncbi:MAG: hypothetical protein HKN49_09160, partial [Gammaproteobacteria bacterium]|nr:hypothetical protein [Gammaproteobacteria bacterium]